MVVTDRLLLYMNLSRPTQWYDNQSRCPVVRWRYEI